MSAADSDRPRTKGADAPLSAYLKWSALMLVIVTVIGVVATQVLHAFGLDQWKLD